MVPINAFTPQSVAKDLKLIYAQAEKFLPKSKPAIGGFLKSPELSLFLRQRSGVNCPALIEVDASAKEFTALCKSYKPFGIRPETIQVDDGENHHYLRIGRVVVNKGQNPNYAWARSEFKYFVETTFTVVSGLVGWHPTYNDYEIRRDTTESWLGCSISAPKFELVLERHHVMKLLDALVALGAEYHEDELDGYTRLEGSFMGHRIVSPWTKPAKN